MCQHFSCVKICQFHCKLTFKTHFNCLTQNCGCLKVPDCAGILSMLKTSCKISITKLNFQCYCCSDGASLCGVFIAVHNAIQQLKMDNAVDVFTIVRQLQIRRPELCDSIVSIIVLCHNEPQLIFLNNISIQEYIYFL